MLVALADAAVAEAAVAEAAGGAIFLSSSYTFFWDRFGAEGFFRAFDGDALEEVVLEELFPMFGEEGGCKSGCY